MKIDRTNAGSITALLLCAGLIGASWWAGRQMAPGLLLPHGYCFTWVPGLLWTHVVSDLLIGLAYVSIPVTLLYFVRRRRDLPFHWIFVLFAVFIVSCGMTHWVDVWTVWNPDYWLAGGVKVVTAGASVFTAAALVMLVPKLLAIPTTAQLQQAKAALEAEIVARQAVEQALREERGALAERVEARTRDLQAATAEAEAARAEAERANRLKDQFLAKVSHELRTPLQGMMGWLQILERGGLPPERVQLAVQRALHNVHAQARLIDDLLDVSRILSGKLSMELQPVEPAQRIRTAVDMLATTAERRQVPVVVDLPPDLPPLQADPTRFEQVVWNLVGNAVQASGPGQTVTVTAAVLPATAAASPRLRVAVADQGHGIERAELPSLFEPFRQSTRPREGDRGLGLGLAITRGIVQQLGGEVTAESEGPGRGARFTVTLPLAAPTDAPAGSAGAPPLSADEEARLRRLRVLYVEDEPDIAEPLREALVPRLGGLTVLHRFDEALPAVRAGGFDLLLTDLQLDAGRTGFELLRALQEHPGRERPPALVLSAFGSAEDRAATAAAGFVAHLVKPVVLAALLAALARAPAA
ncbi:hybrid sensor histidine kinase/response regulator [Aquabacterium sp. J223]|uniref:hybrid sensor histidine kinase/response regulator n=1 Tax=Aquabacterium sp. J223 TaxID=2898431 RepID=UPI0021ADEC30|nr:hybrid sensor histidine kinase/response regulator [Aquabacterium sp. J223]UUX96986.1 hybrid sensor histidine kinase/response regulator [Aquabacterium sp. J223]